MFHTFIMFYLNSRLLLINSSNLFIEFLCCIIMYGIDWILFLWFYCFSLFYNPRIRCFILQSFNKIFLIFEFIFQRNYNILYCSKFSAQSIMGFSLVFISFFSFTISLWVRPQDLNSNLVYMYL